jgi:hypothetical protein
VLGLLRSEESQGPVAGWSLGDGTTTYATTMGYPGLAAVWPGPSGGALERLPDDLDRARRGSDNRLGRRLGVLGIRYVVVVDRLAPVPFAAAERPAAAWLDTTLSSQLDLARLDLNNAVRIYRNEAWLPMTALVPATASSASDLPSPDAAADPTPALVATGDLRFEGDLSTGDVVHLAQSADPGWRLRIDGGASSAGEGFDYANRYEVVRGGPATLAWSGDPWRVPALAVQILAWAVVAAVAVRAGRAGRDPGSDAGRLGRRGHRPSPGDGTDGDPGTAPGHDGTPTAVPEDVAVPS